MEYPGPLGSYKHLTTELPLSALLLFQLPFCMKSATDLPTQVTNALSQEHQSINSFWNHFSTYPLKITLPKWQRRKVTHFGRSCPRRWENQNLLTSVFPYTHNLPGTRRLRWVYSNTAVVSFFLSGRAFSQHFFFFFLTEFSTNSLLIFKE